jgi:spermidine synthase
VSERIEIVRRIEEGGKTLALRRRGEHWDVVLGQVVLLSSAALETELEFGRLVRDIASGARRVLVGGLGFGATVRGVLDVSSADAQVIVVEKLAAIESLARNELAHLASRPLDDPRVRVVHDDVLDVLAGERDLDAILLDVDNGPEWASFRTNARLYAPGGLAAARAALSAGGAYAVWSGYRADAFLGKLRAAGFLPERRELRERGVVQAWAYVGRRPR